MGVSINDAMAVQIKLTNLLLAQTPQLAIAKPVLPPETPPPNSVSLLSQTSPDTQQFPQTFLKHFFLYHKDTFFCLKDLRATRTTRTVLSAILINFWDFNVLLFMRNESQVKPQILGLLLIYYGRYTEYISRLYREC